MGKIFAVIIYLVNVNISAKKMFVLGFFWFIFFGIRTEYGDLLLQMLENANQKNSNHELFSRRVSDRNLSMQTFPDFFLTWKLTNQERLFCTLRQDE